MAVTANDPELYGPFGRPEGFLDLHPVSKSIANILDLARNLKNGIGGINEHMFQEEGQELNSTITSWAELDASRRLMAIRFFGGEALGAASQSFAQDLANKDSIDGVMLQGADVASAQFSTEGISPFLDIGIKPRGKEYHLPLNEMRFQLLTRGVSVNHEEQFMRRRIVNGLASATDQLTMIYHDKIVSAGGYKDGRGIEMDSGVVEPLLDQMNDDEVRRHIRRTVWYGSGDLRLSDVDRLAMLAIESSYRAVEKAE